jgi:hypothetical protein
MKKWFLLFIVLMSASAFAGVVDFSASVNLANEPGVCSATITADCASGVRWFYLQGSSQVSLATAVFAPTASGSVVLNAPGISVKKYGKGVTFFAVVQGKDSAGALIESNPTSAAPVDLIPGKPVTASAIVQ